MLGLSKRLKKLLGQTEDMQSEYSTPILDNIFNRGGTGSFTPDRPWGEGDRGQVTTPASGSEQPTGKTPAQQNQENTRSRFGNVFGRHGTGRRD